MQFVILDLEWNGVYSKRIKKYINEIIEFGAVKIDENMNIVDKFSMLIKPQIGKKICGKVEELTHISNDELTNSNNTFLHAAKMFKDFSRECIILTWGITDISTLIENYDYYLKTKRLDFLESYINLQSYCEHCLDRVDPSKQMGLSAAAELLNIEYGHDNLHRALDDSMLSYECFKLLYNKEKIKSFIKLADEEFYNRIAFKNVMITDLKNPLINKKELSVNCSKCGKKAGLVGNWTVKNKSFRGKFHCKHCEYDFYGKVQFKLKFDGVQVKKAVFEIPKEKEETKQDLISSHARKVL